MEHGEPDRSVAARGRHRVSGHRPAQLDDRHPYIYKTQTTARTGRRSPPELPDGAFVHAVREDPKRKGLLYAGTETGVMVSFDDGDHWQSLQLNLPVSPVHDLVVKNDDLMAATHGRSFWVLDDLAPLRELTRGDCHASRLISSSPASPIAPQIHHRPTMGRPVGENPPTGAVLYYYLKAAPKENEEVTLEILDGEGRAIRKYSSKKQASEEPAEAQEEEEEAGETPANEPIPAEAGLNRFNWDLRYEPATKVNGYSLWDYEGRHRGACGCSGNLPGAFDG